MSNDRPLRETPDGMVICLGCWLLLESCSTPGCYEPLPLRKKKRRENGNGDQVIRRCDKCLRAEPPAEVLELEWTRWTSRHGAFWGESDYG